MSLSSLAKSRLMRRSVTSTWRRASSGAWTMNRLQQFPLEILFFHYQNFTEDPQVLFVDLLHPIGSAAAKQANAGQENVQELPSQTSFDA